MELTATFDGKVFLPDEPIDLEPNTKVKVIVEKSKTIGKPYSSLHFMASLNLDGPSDFSKNLDDYIYGGKKIEDGE
jgi:hypothetical protein